MNKNKIKWHKRFLKQAEDVAEWSKDLSTTVGAVIIDDNRTPRNHGYNGFPRKVKDDVPERHERPLKYKFSEHAERNAIYNCARNGIATKGCTMYVTLHPCSPCARAIIQSGITTVVIPSTAIPDDLEERWKEDFDVAKIMFDEAEVKVISL